MAPLIFLAPLFAAVTAPPVNAPSTRSPTVSPQIVVTAKKLEDTEAALRACIARKCPPDEDINATLAHSENLFAAGEYREARTVLRRSLSRNQDEARRYPVPVSDLHRANAMVNDHLGFDRDYERSTWGILNALKKGIPTPDARHLGARMEIASMRGRLDLLESAQDEYVALARDADKLGRPDIAGIARLRSAGISWRLSPTDAARNQIRAIAALTGEENRVPAAMAKLYLARIAREAGRDTEAQALIREVGGGNFANPILIYSPHYSLSVHEVPKPRNLELTSGVLEAMGNPAASFGGNFDEMWIDVGFWVQADGKVSDLEIVRKKGGSSWSDSLLKSIAGRLYAPAQRPAYRLERYSYTSEWQDQAGSHIKRRSPRARVEYLDLTDDGRIASQ